MKDMMLRATALGNEVRIFSTAMTQTVGEAQERHQSLAVATAALGRTLMATALIGMTLKNDETVTIRVAGDGPLGLIVTNGNANIEVRGYVQNPDLELPLQENGKLDVGGAVGRNGFLHVTKDLQLREPYTSTVPLLSGEIAEDFTYYFTTSEQTPSAMNLGVLVGRDFRVEAAGGLLVQMMPGAGEATLAKVEEILTRMPPVTQLVAGGMNSQQLIEHLFPDAKILESRAVSFACPCSLERLEELLLSLGEAELEDMLEKEGGAELTCHFCGEVYRFSGDDLRRLLAEIKQRGIIKK